MAPNRGLLYNIKRIWDFTISQIIEGITEIKIDEKGNGVKSLFLTNSLINCTVKNKNLIPVKFLY